MRVLLLNPPGPAGRPFVREGRCEQRLSSYAYRMLPISLPSTAGAVRAKGHDVSIVDACGELPPPARDLLPEEDYFLPMLNQPYTLVVPTRGCPHKCTYCTAPSYYGKKLRRRDPRLVVDEMESIVRRGIVKDITMWSDTFTLDRRYVLDFCDELRARELDVRWMCNSRADVLDPGLARERAPAASRGCAFGPEAGL